MGRIDELVRFSPDDVESDSGAGREIQSTTSFARVVYFHYKRQNFKGSTNVRKYQDPDSTVFDVSPGLIEEELLEVTTSKTLDAPAGNFQITMLPSKNWKSVIAPGDWVFIYLYNTTAEAFPFDYKKPPMKNLAMFGNVDGVKRQRQRDEETDKIRVRYSVTGRDFGKVFEDTTIWFDPFSQRSVDIKAYGFLHEAGLWLKGNPSKLVESTLQVFFSKTGAKLASTGTGQGVVDTPPLNQCKVPDDVAAVFNGAYTADVADTSPSDFYFNDILQREIEEDLPGYKYRLGLTPGKNHSVWTQLGRGSNSIVNELFVDLHHDGKDIKPTVFLRPRPNSLFFEDLPGKLNKKFETLSSLVDKGFEIKLDQKHIKFENLGRNHEAQSNTFWIDPRNSKGSPINTFANVEISPEGIGKPMVKAEMVARHGLNMFQGEIDFVYVEAGTAVDRNSQPRLWQSFVNQIFDQKAFNHLYDTGSITSIGNILAQLGSVLSISSPRNKDKKFYYVQGYSHTWKFPGQWETEWTVTMGQFNNSENPFIDVEDIDNGQTDNDFDQGYLAKTNEGR